MVVVPEMIGSIVGVYNGKTYNQVEIKVTSVLSISRYFGAFSTECFLSMLFVIPD